MADILTSLAVWQGFETDGEINAELISEREAGGVKIAQMYIDGEKSESGITKIYAKIAYKKGKTRYGAVIIYNDLASAENDVLLNKFANDGYLAVSVDIGGKCVGKELYTVYPQEYSYADFDSETFSPAELSGNVKSSRWYRWGVAARYAFAYVKKQKSVGRVAIIGIGYSATLVWQMSATVDGVCAAVPILSNGWLAYADVRKFGAESENAFSDDMVKFVAGVEAQSFAVHAACPVLSLIATNNARFDCDRAYDTMARIKNDVYKALDYSVGYVEGTDSRSVENLSLFLAKYLKSEKVYLPEEPQIKAEITENSLRADVCFDAKTAKSVQLFYSEGVDTPSLRSWHKIEKPADEKGEASFEFSPSRMSERIYLFSRVKYENGFTIGSDIICKKQRKEAGIKNKILYSALGKDTESLFIGKTGIDVPSVLDVEGKGEVTVVGGPMGIEGICADGGIVTYKINAESDKPEDDAILMFDVYSKKPTALTVKLIEGTGRERVAYFAEVNLNGNRAWKNVMLERNKFKTSEGMILKSYEKVSAIEIDSAETFLINNLLWL